MMRHLFKMVWNRKRTNALLILEIFFSFLVVFVVGTLGIYFWSNYRRPLGFAWEDVVSVNIDMKQVSDDTHTPEQVATFARLLREVQALDPVEAVAGSMGVPFELGTSTGLHEYGGRSIEFDFNEVTQDFDKVMRPDLARGRWFQPADAALAWEPLVIDQDLARTAFGDEDPVGKLFGDPERQRRVIGVVRDYRSGGELTGVRNYLFNLKRAGHPDDRPARNLLVRLRPGTPAAFEEELIERLQAVAPEWSFEARPLWQLRESAFRLRLTPVIAGAVVAFFLLLMVGLGLLGVLWQNLLQRTREIGLRRAAGASRAEVHRQIVLEQLLVTTLGVLLGTALVVQIPVLDLVGFIRPGVFAGGILLAMATMYLLTALCVLYPSMMASRIQPAEALRYE
ncbi:MAG TPA: FtsX-like permease family protein [Thermoanaerobaculia bacterium]